MTLTEQGKELAKEYELELSIAYTILTPGKFEGEHVTTLVFWEAYLNGYSEEGKEGILLFELEDKERDELGNMTNLYRLYVDDNGFVRGNI